VKLLLLCVAMASQLFAFASLSLCQETNAKQDRLHFLFPFPDGHGVVFRMEASSAQRILSDAQTGDVLQLRGNVELTMIPRPAARVPRQRIGQEDSIPRSTVVLRADGVDYNEKTGEIHTHGDVHIVLIDQVSKKAAAK
jgi:hypothetical protein